jgi:hypothetical protein
MYISSNTFRYHTKVIEKDDPFTNYLIINSLTQIIYKIFSSMGSVLQIGFMKINLSESRI